MTTMTTVIQAVATTYGVTADEILGDGQERRVAEPRHVAMYLCRHRVPRATFTKLARKFGRSHSTVARSVEIIESRRISPVLEAVLKRLEQTLAANHLKTKETAHVR